MDWKKITDSVTPYINKAKEYGKKVAVFTENQIQTTPIFIKTQLEIDEVLMAKRAVILAYEDTGSIADEIRVLSSVWFMKAFVDVSKLRMINITEFPDLARTNNFVWPIDMRVQFEWEQTYRFNTIDDVKKWWKSPCYKKAEIKDEVKNETPEDPLKGK